MYLVCHRHLYLLPLMHPVGCAHDAYSLPVAAPLPPGIRGTVCVYVVLGPGRMILLVPPDTTRLPHASLIVYLATDKAT